MRDALSLLDQIIDLKDETGYVSFDDLLNFTGMVDKKIIHDLVKKIISGDSAGVIRGTARTRCQWKRQQFINGSINRISAGHSHYEKRQKKWQKRFCFVHQKIICLFVSWVNSLLMSIYTR